jgi:hypothetical protein
MAAEKRRLTTTGCVVQLLTIVPLLFPAMSQAQWRANAARDTSSSPRGSSYPPPQSQSNLPLAAAQALERARQYQHMGNAINRALDDVRRSLEESFERDRRRQEEAEQREEQARRREHRRVVATDGCTSSYASGKVFWHGPSQAIYVKTPVYAKITDANGNGSPRGGYLTLKNTDLKNPVYWTSIAAGQHDRYLGPGEEDRVYLAIYSGPNSIQELVADLQVIYCR